MKQLTIVIFAKAPVAGFAKTRLIPALGSAGAARLARRMLDATLRAAVAAGVGSVELCVTPDPAAFDWSTLLGIIRAPSVMVSGQGGGDLGARLARVARRITYANRATLLIGTDCPGLGSSVLCAAAAALEANDAVLVPSLDGGYVLLGLNRYHASLFRGVSWGTATVAAATSARLDALGWTTCRLPALRDIDEPNDLPAVPKGWLDGR
ncbi:MAG: TIGR04282 family arsenosugar biosynthesis glycosyltransferase [Gammaproteobacteria bacterium]|nr:TIGR04282 family arsenosugar biosynthesis glycosyltransferase [Gammaproteobacteria bacterium]